MPAASPMPPPTMMGHSTALRTARMVDSKRTVAPASGVHEQGAQAKHFTSDRRSDCDFFLAEGMGRLLLVAAVVNGPSPMSM